MRKLLNCSRLKTTKTKRRFKMAKIIEKIKNLFSSKAKKEKPKPQEGKSKVEEKPEKQK